LVTLKLGSEFSPLHGIPACATGEALNKILNVILSDASRLIFPARAFCGSRARSRTTLWFGFVGHQYSQELELYPRPFQYFAGKFSITR